jgi:hypothetical protein
VEQHNWNAVRIALLDVGQLKLMRKHRQMHHALILSGPRGRPGADRSVSEDQALLARRCWP